ncbi:MAG: hypothetical protein K0Q74_1164 [Gammaproteobacteria bacterium]|jgi:hypothetical protein|nr:hypothetical protein [Gammaproteobacteria bacterium]
MSKKIITALFATLVLAFGITACQPKDSGTSSSDGDTVTTTEINSQDGTTTTESTTTTE